MLQVARVDTFLAAVLSDQETFSLLLPLEPPSSSSSSPSSANSAAPDTETCAKTPLLGVGTPRSNPSSNRCTKFRQGIFEPQSIIAAFNVLFQSG
ncbi:hypothetical protein CCHR01_18332 [Colletotrichum chrysophilum]|uniref:Uncharacterized protein n=1 Tax=Colletotrichum chrysophilum TaxID=1836956 RepID=A0AAD9A0B5_9PEZI|nr:hypothetical protein CCHR01_18332 [Colletotrichum chrysophilum]